MVRTGFTLALLAMVPVFSQAQDRTSFRDVVDAHFTHWTTGAADGRLTAARVTALVNRKEVTGDEAAALASIRTFFRDFKPGGSLSRAEITAALGREASLGRRDAPATSPHLEGLFQHTREPLRTTPRAIFTPGGPRRAGIVQGQLGDCYIVAVVGAALEQRPRLITGMFQPYTSGACDITFADGRRVRVPALTDGQMALGSSAGSQGTWLPALEVAFGMRKGEGKATGAEALDAIGRGGDPGHSIELITGHRSVALSLQPSRSRDPVTARAEDMALAARLRETLRSATMDRRLVVANTSLKSLAPPGMIGNHAHAVLRYDTSTDWVTVWNPWGNDFVPREMAGVGQGYTVRNGEFALTIPEFLRVFDEIQYESTTKVK